MTPAPDRLCTTGNTTCTPRYCGGGTKYVRADIHDAVEVERDALRAALIDAQKWVGVFMDIHGYPMDSYAAAVLGHLVVALKAKP